MLQPLVHQVIVFLRQIEAIFDYSKDVGGEVCSEKFEKAPEEFSPSNVRTFLWGKPGSLAKIYGLMEITAADYFDSQAADVDVPHTYPDNRIDVLQGIYGPNLDSSYHRSFDRAKSSPITGGRYVYVFQCTNGEGKAHHGGSKPRLYAELKFENGKVQHMDQKNWESSKQEWQRLQAGGWKEEEKERSLDNSPEDDDNGIILDLHALNEDKQILRDDRGVPAMAHYFFYLAERQLPWDGVERLRANLGARAVRLFDWLYTDFCLDPMDAGKPERWKTLLPTPPPDSSPGTYRQEPNLEPYRNQPIYFVLHLPNVMQEALRRADEYHQALLRTLPSNAQIPADQKEKQLLARMVDLITRNEPALRRLVTKKLFPVIYPKVKVEGDGVKYAHRRMAILQLCAQDLVSWLGVKQQRFGHARWDHQPLNTGPAVPYAEDQKASAFSCSPFSEAADDYLHAPVKTRNDISESVVTNAIALLPETALGQAFLDETLKLNLCETKPNRKADRWASPVVAGQAGLPLVLSLLKELKTEKDLSFLAVNTAIRVYTNPWARYAGNEKVLERVKEWVNKHGKAGRVTYVDLENSGKFGWKVEGTDSGAKIQPNLSAGMLRASSAAKGVMSLTSAIESTANLIYGLQKMREGSGDPATLIAATGSAAKCIQSYDEFRRYLESAVKGKAVVSAPAFMTPLSYVTNAIMVGTSANDLLGSLTRESLDSGEIVGHSLQLAGTCLGLVSISAISVGTAGLAIVIPIVAWGVKWVGQKAIDQFSKPATFLRACELGEHVSFFDFGSDDKARRVAEKMELPRVSTKYDEKWQKGWSTRDQIADLEADIMYDFEIREGRRIDQAQGASNLTAQLVFTLRFPQCLISHWRFEVVDLRVEIRQDDLALPGTPSQIRTEQYESSLCWSDDVKAGAPALGQLYRDKKQQFVMDLATLLLKDLMQAGSPASGSSIRPTLKLIATGQAKLTISPTVGGKVEQVISKDIRCPMVILL